ncbi:HEAT repeat domain-containing protein, partial [Amycolatopsis mediterranei]
ELSEPVITALLQLATNPDIDPYVRVEAGSALAGRGELSEPVITALLQLATDPFVEVEARSVLANGGELSEPVITALLQLATDSNPDIDPSARVQAGSVLADAGELSEPVITALLQLATDSNPDIDPSARVQAGSVLADAGELSEPVITALLQLATEDEDYSVREQAVKALQHALPTRSLRKAVAELFRDDDNDVRRATAATFVEWSRRHQQYFNEIGSDLTRACTDPALEVMDKYEHRTGWDYAHRGLAAHVETLNNPTIDR